MTKAAFNFLLTYQFRELNSSFVCAAEKTKRNPKKFWEPFDFSYFLRKFDPTEP